jgi:hypothetical protein
VKLHHPLGVATEVPTEVHAEAADRVSQNARNEKFNLENNSCDLLRSTILPMSSSCKSDENESGLGSCDGIHLYRIFLNH